MQLPMRPIGSLKYLAQVFSTPTLNCVSIKLQTSVRLLENLITLALSTGGKEIKTTYICIFSCGRLFGGDPLYVRALWRSGRGIGTEAWRKGVVFVNVRFENGDTRYSRKDHCG